MSSNKIIKEAFNFKSEDDAIQFEAETIHLDMVNELKKLMDSKNMNKADLAKALGTTKGYVTQLFSGDRLFNLKTFAKIQRIFNVKIEIQFVKKSKKNVSAKQFLKKADKLRSGLFLN